MQDEKTGAVEPVLQAPGTGFEPASPPQGRATS